MKRSALLLVTLLMLAFCAGASATTVTLTPTLDTSVEAGSPTTTFATGNDLVGGYPRHSLRIDGDPTRYALLRFQVPALQGTPTAATLRVYKRVGSPSEVVPVALVDCSAWSASTTYNTRPALGANVGTMPGYPAPGAGWMEAALTPTSVAGGQPYCVALNKGIRQPTWITADSMEDANPPQLVIDVPGDTTPPSQITNFTATPQPAGSCTNDCTIPATWNQATDNVGVDHIDSYRDGLLVGTLPGNATSGVYGGTLDCGTTHTMKLVAVDAAGNRSPDAVLTASTAACQAPPPPPSGNVSDCSDAPVVNVTPSTMASTLANNNRVRIVAAPGSYSGLSKTGNSTSCISIKCSASAKSGTFSSNPSGCILTSQSTFQNVKDLTVESFVVKSNGSGEYGLQHYDQANVGSNTRFANNVFDETNDHDISTKNRGTYIEVVDNWFLSCSRHCFEIGQNGNIRTRPSTTGTTVFRGNVAYSPTGNIITQRYNLNLIVENNTFKGAAGRVVMNWPYWAKYNFPDSGAEAACRNSGSENGDLYVPGSAPCEGGTYKPLRTTVRNNTFSGKSDLLFISRGVIDDSVLVQGNTGITSCGRASMDYWTSGTAAAHINEQTTAPPVLDSASDVSCPVVG